jgi:multimeric flavodoxin WrbA
MHILAILGSRNPEGMTARAMKSLLEGAAEAGVTSESVYLPLIHIEHCRQCNDDGWGVCLKEGRCVIEDDDFASLTEKIRAADAVVFATPVYIGEPSESMKAYMDRLRRTARFSEIGRRVTEKKPAICISVAGGGGANANMCNGIMERACMKCGMDLMDLVPVRRQNLDLKCSQLKIEGKWLVEQVEK